MPRNPFLILQVGTNGSGKTTESLELVKHNKRGVIFPAQRYDVKEWVDKLPRGANHLVYSDGNISYGQYHKGKLKKQAWTVFECLGSQKDSFEGMLKFVPELASNGGCIVDDCKKYIHAKHELPGYVIDLLIDRRHIATDLIFNVHAYQYLNPDFLSYDPLLVIRYTSMPPKKYWLSNLDESKQAEFWEKYKRVAQVNADLKRAGKNPIHSELLFCSP